MVKRIRGGGPALHTSLFAAALARGEVPTAAEWAQHLKEAHRSAPGMTPRAFGGYATADGQTSYERLAGAVPTSAKRVLDLACGDGHLAHAVLSRLANDARIVGVDVSDEELAIARSAFADEGRVTFEAASAERLLFDDSSFDAVLCHLALMLFSPVEPVVAEVARVLVGGGTFAAVLPFPHGAEGVCKAVLDRVQAAVVAAFPAVAQAPRGDPRCTHAGGLRELFCEKTAFVDLRVEPIALDLATSAEGLWAFVEDMYLVGALPEAARDSLRRDLRRTFGDSVRFQFPLQQMVARRSLSSREV